MWILTTGRGTFLTCCLVLLLGVIGLLGCERQSATQGDGEVVSELRLISLSPAITRTLIDLGAGDLIVGRTGFCRVEDTSIPVVGDLLTLDHERIVKLRPTHVLVQPPKSGIGEDLTRLAATGGWSLETWSLNGMEDIARMIDELPDVATVIDAERHTAMRAKADELLARLETLRTVSPGVFTGRTLLLSEVDPVLVFGRGSYLGDLLEAQGGRNASNAEGWAMLSMEDVVRLAPEAIIVVRDDGGGEALVEALSAYETPASQSGRIEILAHPESLIPSSALLDVAERLREILVGWEA